jgi:hypothetical protein
MTTEEKRQDIDITIHPLDQLPWRVLLVKVIVQVEQVCRQLLAQRIGCAPCHMLTPIGRGHTQCLMHSRDTDKEQCSAYQERLTCSHLRIVDKGARHLGNHQLCDDTAKQQ